MASKKTVNKAETTTEPNKKVVKTEVGVIMTPTSAPTAKKKVVKAEPVKKAAVPKPKKTEVKAKPKPVAKPIAKAAEVKPKPQAPEKPKENYGVCNTCLSPLVKLLYDSKAAVPRYFICCNNKACPKYRFVLSWDPGPP